MSEKIGVLLCGHGSRDEDAIRQFAAVAAGVARRLPQYDVDHGFLEFAQPVKHPSQAVDDVAIARP